MCIRRSCSLKTTALSSNTSTTRYQWTVDCGSHCLMNSVTHWYISLTNCLALSCHNRWYQTIKLVPGALAVDEWLRRLSTVSVSIIIRPLAIAIKQLACTQIRSTYEEWAENVERDEERERDAGAATLSGTVWRLVAHNWRLVRARHHYVLPSFTGGRSTTISTTNIKSLAAFIRL